jgi:hypothetical protein
MRRRPPGVGEHNDEILGGSLAGRKGAKP